MSSWIFRYTNLVYLFILTLYIITCHMIEEALEVDSNTPGRYLWLELHFLGISECTD